MDRGETTVTKFDHTWRRWLPRYGLCNTDQTAHQLFKLYPLQGVEYVKISVWKQILEGIQVEQLMGQLHNPYRGNHRRQG